MPWFYLIVIAILISFLLYVADLLNKMGNDIKYLRNKLD